MFMMYYVKTARHYFETVFPCSGLSMVVFLRPNILAYFYMEHPSPEMLNTVTDGLCLLFTEVIYQGNVDT